MNNPIQFLRSIKNPQILINNMMNNPMISNNPIAKNAFEMYQKGDIEGINKLAENLCKEKGTTTEEVAKRIMSQIGM